MSEYSTEFAAKLAEVATNLANKSKQDLETSRVVVYISRLSLELSLKGLLEHAGVSVADIRSRSHNLRGLLDDVGRCEVQSELPLRPQLWVSASSLRSEVIRDATGSTTTVGNVVDAESVGASHYPNQIRYGKKLVDFPTVVLAQAAMSVASWTSKHSNDIRISTRHNK